MTAEQDPGDLMRRAEALRHTFAKYRDREVDFRDADCIRMARSHLVQMGHKPPPLPGYRSLIGARRALRRAGFATLEEMFDGLLPRIVPARMLPGDLMVLKGEPGSGLDSAAIAVNLGQALGWWDGRCAVLRDIKEYIAAYRA